MAEPEGFALGVVKYSPNQPRDEHGRWTASGSTRDRQAKLTAWATKQTRDEGGFSIRAPRRGRTKVPREGYALSLWPERSLIIPQSTSRRQARRQLTEWVRKNRDLLDRKGMHIGGWLDSDSGNVYIDVSVIYPKRHRAKAMAHARMANQKAIYDLGAGEEIEIGGTGEAINKAREDGVDRHFISTSGRSEEEIVDELLDALGYEDEDEDDIAKNIAKLWATTGTVHGSQGRWSPEMLKKTKGRAADRGRPS